MSFYFCADACSYFFPLSYSPYLPPLLLDLLEENLRQQAFQPTLAGIPKALFRG